MSAICWGDWRTNRRERQPIRGAETRPVGDRRGDCPPRRPAATDGLGGGVDRDSPGSAGADGTAGGSAAVRAVVASGGDTRVAGAGPAGVGIPPPTAGDDP